MDKKEINAKIDGWLNKATHQQYIDGMNWYLESNRFCSNLAKEYNISIKKVVGILSALSPMKEYNLNKKLVESFLNCQNCGHLSNQLRKCHDIFNGEDDDNYILNTLSGRKTESFYHNILYPTSSDKITIDFRMWKYFKYDGWNSLTSKKYGYMEQVFLQKASEYNIIGLQLQAILWIVTKNHKNVS